ncbi:MAG: GIY-YIG nuclease family protein [Pelagibacterales bacterium]|nr:GIY-YIG nuclease family protein [Pelagibacterales bacterium]
MVNYNQSIIYKIVCLNTSITPFYIGSTTNMNRRRQYHKDRATNSKYNNIILYNFIRRNGGWTNWCLSPIVIVNVNNKAELKAKEEQYIAEENPELSLNKIIISDVLANEESKTHDLLKTNQNIQKTRYKSKKVNNKNFLKNQIETIQFLNQKEADEEKARNYTQSLIREKIRIEEQAQRVKRQERIREQIENKKKQAEEIQRQERREAIKKAILIKRKQEAILKQQEEERQKQQAARQKQQAILKQQEARKVARRKEEEEYKKMEQFALNLKNKLEREAAERAKHHEQELQRENDLKVKQELERIEELEKIKVLEIIKKNEFERVKQLEKEKEKQKINKLNNIFRNLEITPDKPENPINNIFRKLEEEHNLTPP